MTDIDRVLRRVERNAVVVCAVIALTVGVAARGRLGAPAGVLAGGTLVAISYRGIKGGLESMVGGASGAAGAMHLGGGPPSPLRQLFRLVKFFTRYAILAAVAYVILVRLRLSPLAVVAGASSGVVAVAVEALGQLRHRPGGRTGTKAGLAGSER